VLGEPAGHSRDGEADAGDDRRDDFPPWCAHGAMIAWLVAVVRGETANFCS
jgi:hypothetical protein